MADLLRTFVFGIAVAGGTFLACLTLFNLATDEPDPNHGPGVLPTLRWRLGTLIQRNPAPLLIGTAALAGFGLGALFMAPRGLDAATAQACTRTVATLLTTRDAVELERSRYLVGELGCDVHAALPGVEATADAAPGLPRAGAAQAGASVGAFLLNGLVVTVVFVGGSFLTFGFLNWLTDRRKADT